MALITVELACGKTRPVMYAGANDLRCALAAHNVHALYDSTGTMITPEALSGASKIKAVFALSPRSRVRRHLRDRVQSAWAAVCTVATLALLLRAVDIVVSPWWLVAFGLCVGTWELSLGTQKCTRSAATMAIAVALAAAHLDDARDALVRVLYSVAEPRACTWLGCRVRHACPLQQGAGEYCALFMQERVGTSLSYLYGATVFAAVWSATQSLPTPIRTVCAGCLCYCVKTVGGAHWVPEPPIID